MARGFDFFFNAISLETELHIRLCLQTLSQFLSLSRAASSDIYISWEMHTILLIANAKKLTF